MEKIRVVVIPPMVMTVFEDGNAIGAADRPFVTWIDDGLAPMQRLVAGPREERGFIEHVSLPGPDGGIGMWLNEEGQLGCMEGTDEDGNPFLWTNPAATMLCEGHCLMTDRGTLGPVFLTGGVDDAGETLGLSDSQVEYLHGKLDGLTEAESPWPVTT